MTPQGPGIERRDLDSVTPIHFSRRSPTKSDDQEHEMLPLRIGALIIMVGAFLTSVVQRATGLGLPFTSGFGCLLLMVGLVIAAIWQHVQIMRRNRAAASLDASPDENYRLRCVGLPAEVQQHGSFADVPFEPSIFNGSFTLPYTRRVWWAAAAIGLVAFAGLRLGNWVTTGSAFRNLAWDATVLPLPIWGVVALLWPTYLRVVPGRLDVVHYGRFPRRRAEVWSMSLRDARILVDLRRMRVRIDSPDEGAPVEFSIGLLPRRTRFAYMLFLAAMSSYQPPPIADGELTG